MSDIDIEKKGPIYDENNAVIGESFAHGNGTYAKLQRLAGKLSIEQRGIERVPENERTDTSLANVGTMWLSANMVISSFAIGTLGQAIFYMGFLDTTLTIIFFNLLSIIPVAFFSGFGPKFGLRQMVLSRFYFGWWGVRVIAVFNILACVGWSAVNVIVGSQLIYAVNHGVKEFAGIIIIAVCTAIITVFGYKVVHVYEKWSWIPVTAIFIVVIVQFSRSGTFTYQHPTSGPAEAASVLSLGASVFGFGTGWTSYAADYTVYQPPTQSRTKVFIWTYGGLIIPLLFTEILGAAIMTGALSSPVYASSYEDAAVGGLLNAVLVENSLGKFGQFCLIVLALSIIANNCPNIYSIALSVQLLGKPFQRVPRFVWTLLGTVIYVAIAIPGAHHFNSTLENFMLLIGYWLAIYEAIALSEHFIFRKGIKGYIPEDYETPSRLPPSFAALTAFCFGVFGAVMGMAQVWFVGPIAKHTGNPVFGGDIGFELAFAFTSVVYIPLRYFEKKHFGR